MENHGLFRYFSINCNCCRYFIFQLSDTEKIRERIRLSAETISNIDSYDRVLSTKATWEMTQDRLAYGWGQGSFRYIFPIYQKSIMFYGIILTERIEVGLGEGFTIMRIMIGFNL